MSLLNVGAGLETGAALTAQGSVNNKMAANCFIMLEPLFREIDRAPKRFGPRMRHGFTSQYGVQRLPQIELGRHLPPDVEVLHEIVDAPQIEQRPLWREEGRRTE